MKKPTLPSDQSPHRIHRLATVATHKPPNSTRERTSMQSSVQHCLCISAFVVAVVTNVAQSQQLQWREGSTGQDASLRGLSVVDDQTLWASGANATVVRSVDGGVNWKSCGPKGLDKLEMRSIVAFDEKHATIASAGTPAIILQTDDGGQNWKEVFRHSSAAAFFDGMRFWDRNQGIAFSDPVAGRILIVTTVDGGATWQEVAPDKIPLAADKEGGFAASNSVLCVGKGGHAWIGTGGAKSASSRIYATTDFGKSWSVRTCPLSSDTTAGVFSIALHSEMKLLLAVGGDYRPEATSNTTAALSRDLGQTWQLASMPPATFVSAVCMAQSKFFVATGPTSSFSSNDGDQWTRFSSVGFHALEASPAGHVYAVGSGGRFGHLEMNRISEPNQ